MMVARKAGERSGRWGPSWVKILINSEKLADKMASAGDWSALRVTINQTARTYISSLGLILSQS